MCPGEDNNNNNECEKKSRKELGGLEWIILLESVNKKNTYSHSGIVSVMISDMRIFMIMAPRLFNSKRTYVKNIGFEEIKYWIFSY